MKNYCDYSQMKYRQFFSFSLSLSPTFFSNRCCLIHWDTANVLSNENAMVSLCVRSSILKIIVENKVSIVLALMVSVLFEVCKYKRQLKDCCQLWKAKFQTANSKRYRFKIMWRCQLLFSLHIFHNNMLYLFYQMKRTISCLLFFLKKIGNPTN